MRPVDLATRAGVSTQQIRNLEAAGVLPPADRTGSGYRVYRGAHLSALLCYQALARGHGAGSARSIMEALSTGQIDQALALLDASHHELHQQRQALTETSQALTRVAAAVEHHAGPDAPLSIGELADYLGIRTSALRVWEHAGLLAPARQTSRRHRVYDSEDVRDARIIHLLRQGRYRFDRIRPIITELRGRKSADALQAALTERRTSLTHRARAMLDGAALLQQHITEFIASDAPAPSEPVTGS